MEGLGGGWGTDGGWGTGGGGGMMSSEKTFDAGREYVVDDILGYFCFLVYGA